MKTKMLHCAVALLLMGTTAWAQASVGDVYIDPADMSDESLTPGTLVQFTIQATDMVQISTMALSVTFDPNVLQFVAAQLGTFFDNQTPLTIANGETTPGVYELVAAVGGVFLTGNYSLVVLNFMVNDIGSTDLILGDGPGGGGNPDYPSFVGAGFFIVDPASVTHGFFSNDGSTGGGGDPGDGGGGGGDGDRPPPVSSSHDDESSSVCSATAGSSGLPALPVGLLLLIGLLLIRRKASPALRA